MLRLACRYEELPAAATAGVELTNLGPDGKPLLGPDGKPLPGERFSVQHRVSALAAADVLLVVLAAGAAAAAGAAPAGGDAKTPAADPAAAGAAGAAGAGAPITQPLVSPCRLHTCDQTSACARVRSLQQPLLSCLMPRLRCLLGRPSTRCPRTRRPLRCCARTPPRRAASPSASMSLPDSLGICLRRTLHRCLVLGALLRLRLLCAVFLSF